MGHELRLEVHPCGAHEYVVVDLSLEHVGHSLRVRHRAGVHVEHGVEFLPSQGRLANLPRGRKKGRGEGWGEGGEMKGGKLGEERGGFGS